MPERSGLDVDQLAYYRRGREQDRLATVSRVELIRTRELLGRFLPPPPGRILDIGGGAGVHALAVQDRGDEVTLVDPVALHVDQARAAGVRRVASAGPARRGRLARRSRPARRPAAGRPPGRGEPALLGASPHLLAVAHG